MIIPFINTKNALILNLLGLFYSANCKSTRTINSAGKSDDKNGDGKRKKSPGTKSPGIPFFIPGAKLSVHEEPTSCVMGRSSGFRFILIAALPIQRGQWLYDFRHRSQRRVRNGISPFSLETPKGRSITRLCRLPDPNFVVNSEDQIIFLQEL